MASSAMIQRMMAGIRIYWDPDAFRSELGRRQYLEMKPLHDELFRTAIDLELASAVVFTERQKPLPGLREVCSVASKQPTWWPANRTLKSRTDLLMLPVATSGRTWQMVRDLAEPSAKRATLWHDDPALIFSRSPDAFFCRTATVGHEGHVFYFVYSGEERWEAEILRFALPLFGEGEQAYRQLVPVPGAFAGKE